MDNPLDTRTLPPRRPEARRGKATPPAAKRTGGLLGSLKIWQKLLLIVLAFVLPLLVVVGLLVNEENKTIAFNAKALRGAEYLTAVGELMAHVPEGAGFSSSYLTGNASFAQNLQEKAAAVDRSLAKLVALDGRFGAEFGTTEQVAALREYWTEFKGNLLTLNLEDSIDTWEDLIDEHLSPLAFNVANRSNLILDSDLDTYYIAATIVNDMPKVLDEIGDVQGRSLEALSAIDDDLRASFKSDFDSGEDVIERIDRAAAVVKQANPAVGEPFQKLTDTASGAAITFFETVTSEVLDAPTPQVGTTRLINLGVAATGAYSDVLTSGLETLRERLEGRIADLRQRLTVQLSLVALTLALTFALAAFISRRISGPVGQLFSASQRLSQGDLNAQAAVSSTDELGALAKTFNETVAQLRLKAASDAEAQARNDQLQRNIGEFLNTAMDISDGDFTKRGVVTDDVLGSVVDAINLMVEEVALLLTDVQDAALSVNEGAGEMLTSTGVISQTAQRTAGEAQRIRGEVQGVVVSIQDMARQADTASSAAARALKASLEGQAAVNDTLAGMAGIRDETRSTAERVQSLAARSAEISEIVETISHIASQTNLLALGAALEAAGAGDAGDRFAVVADEVRKLADESAEAAGRIDGLISTIQSEVKEVGAQVERNSVEVEVGYRLAGEAGERLREISASVQQSAGLAQSISQATGVQTGSVKEVGFAVQAMADLAERSRERVSQGQEAAERLRQVAERLSEALVRFRLA